MIVKYFSYWMYHELLSYSSTKGDVRFPEVALHSPFQLKLCESTSSIGVTVFCLCVGILSFHASSDGRFWMVTDPHPR